MRPMKPRLFLVEDQTALLETFTIAFPKLLNCDVVGTARTGAETLKRVPEAGCDLLWMDVGLAPLDGPGVLRLLRSRGVDVPTVLFTGLECDLRIDKAMDAEPDGFVHKADDFRCWREAFDAVLRGGRFVSPRIAAVQKRPSGTVLSNVTDIERAVLVLAVNGEGNDSIGAQLGISPHTARHHRERLMNKLSVHSIEALCALACREGLIDCKETTDYERAPQTNGELRKARVRTIAPLTKGQNSL
jgi:DNA-binding NarL/FixJ family response regulator